MLCHGLLPEKQMSTKPPIRIELFAWSREEHQQKARNTVFLVVQEYSETVFEAWERLFGGQFVLTNSGKRRLKSCSKSAAKKAGKF